MTAVLCVVCIPLGTGIDSVAALALVTALAVGLIAYEVLRFRAGGARVRMRV